MMGLFVLAVSSCASRHATDVEPERAQRQLEGVTYRKSGGLAGMNEWATITSDGHIQVSGRYSGEGEGQLSAEQQRALVDAFTEWAVLKDEYLPDRPAVDGMTVYIQYGKKGVTVVEPADVPAEFRNAVTVIEGVVRGVTRKK